MKNILLFFSICIISSCITCFQVIAHSYFRGTTDCWDPAPWLPGSLYRAILAYFWSVLHCPWPCTVITTNSLSFTSVFKGQIKTSCNLPLLLNVFAKVNKYKTLYERDTNKEEMLQLLRSSCHSTSPPRSLFPQ